jgi:hypothetical protein
MFSPRFELDDVPLEFQITLFLDYEFFSLLIKNIQM